MLHIGDQNLPHSSRSIPPAEDCLNYLKSTLGTSRIMNSYALTSKKVCPHCNGDGLVVCSITQKIILCTACKGKMFIPLSKTSAQ